MSDAIAWSERTGAWIWVRVPLSAILFLAAIDRLDKRAEPNSEWRVTSAQLLLSDADDPSSLGADEHWEQIRLPHWRLRLLDTGAVSSAWYRIRLHRGAPSRELWAVYCRNPLANLVVFVNGVEIGTGGAIKPPIPFYRTPLYFVFPGQLLRPGDNLIDVHSVRQQPRTHLDIVYVGPEVAIRAVHRYGYLLSGAARWASVVAMLVIAAMMSGLYYLRRSERAYGWYAAALCMWSLHIALLLIPQSFVNNRNFSAAFGSVCQAWFVVFAALFINRFVAVQQPQIERALLGFGAIGSMGMLGGALLASSWLATFEVIFFTPTILLVGAYLVWQVVVASLRAPSLENRLLLLVAFNVLCVGVRDYLVDVGIVGTGGRQLYLTYTVGFVLVVFGMILLKRFAHAMSEVEKLNRELEARVAQKALELEQNYEVLGLLERDRTLSVERERIMRDMHDGVGSQIMQALLLVERADPVSAINDVLRSSLQDLRLIIDSLERVDGDVLSVLATFRARTQRQLVASGIVVSWQVQEVPRIPELGPDRVLQMLRIVQESVTNILKHAAATQIIFATRIDALADG